MNEIEIQEENKLIAEFMGVKIGRDDYSWRPGVTDKLRVDHLGYHKEWGWLMPVVEKIIQEWETHPKPRPSFIGFTQPIETHLMPVNWLLNIELMWKEVVQFIKWYNENI